MALAKHLSAENFEQSRPLDRLMLSAWSEILAVTQGENSGLTALNSLLFHLSGQSGLNSIDIRKVPHRERVIFRVAYARMLGNPDAAPNSVDPDINKLLEAATSILHQHDLPHKQAGELSSLRDFATYLTQVISVLNEVGDNTVVPISTDKADHSP